MLSRRRNAIPEFHSSFSAILNRPAKLKDDCETLRSFSTLYLISLTSSNLRKCSSQREFYFHIISAGTLYADVVPLASELTRYICDRVQAMLMFSEDLRALESLKVEHVLPDLTDHLEWRGTTVCVCGVGH